MFIIRLSDWGNSCPVVRGAFTVLKEKHRFLERFLDHKGPAAELSPAPVVRHPLHAQSVLFRLGCVSLTEIPLTLLVAFTLKYWRRTPVSSHSREVLCWDAASPLCSAPLWPLRAGSWLACLSRAAWLPRGCWLCHLSSPRWQLPGQVFIHRFPDQSYRVFNT